MNDQTMTANIEKMTDEPKNMQGIRRKPLIRAYHVLDAARPVDKYGYADAIIDARLYMGASRSASNVYAAIWVHEIGEKDDRRYASGTGSAGGCGYDKESAAIDEAISAAGIDLEYTNTDGSKRRAYIAGVGETAVREALLAIATACGASCPFIVESFA